MTNADKAKIHLLARTILREQKSMSEVPDEIKDAVLEKMAWLRANDPDFASVDMGSYEGQE